MPYTDLGSLRSIHLSNIRFDCAALDPDANPLRAAFSTSADLIIDGERGACRLDAAPVIGLLMVFYEAVTSSLFMKGGKSDYRDQLQGFVATYTLSGSLLEISVSADRGELVRFRGMLQEVAEILLQAGLDIVLMVEREPALTPARTLQLYGSSGLLWLAVAQREALTHTVRLGGYKVIVHLPDADNGEMAFKAPGDPAG